MPNETSILGTSGKDPLPFDFQVEEQKIARQRAMAQLMMQRGMAAPPEPARFGRHVANPGIMPYLANALQGFLGQKDAGMADQAQADLGRRAQAAKMADLQGVQSLVNGVPGQMVPQAGPLPEGGAPLPDIEQGGVKPNLKAAIARSMQSPWASVQQYGAGLQKREDSQVSEIAKLLTGARGAEFMQGGNSRAPIPELKPQPLEFSATPSGAQIASTVNPTSGARTFQFEPKGTSITNTLDARTGSKAMDKAIEYFNYGGEGYKLGQAAVKSLGITSDILSTLGDNPQMGAGGELFQAVRKWATALGAPINPDTTPTEMAKMQLGQKTLDRLGGLGAQVSDADRKFMLETQGSITNDPEAVRRMMLIEAKYLMKLVDQTNMQVNELAGRMPGEVALPGHTFKFAPSGRNAEDLERLIKGEGFAPPPGAPAPSPGSRIKPRRH